MTDEHESSRPGTLAPIRTLAAILGSAWNTVKTIYWANSRSWRFLKSGTLVFFGFFLWAGSNILYSYNPSANLLHYVMAYGFLLVVYGPIHHLVVVPAAVRWRRKPGLRQRFAGPLPNVMLVIFVAAVLVLGTVPVAPVTVDFQAHLDGGSSDVSPDLTCEKASISDGTSITCSLSNAAGIGSVVVRSDGTVLQTADEPPYEFTVRERDLGTVTGETQFTVVLQDGDGNLIRRYTRRLAVVPEAG